jgi:hypothetical protein
MDWVDRGFVNSEVWGASECRDVDPYALCSQSRRVLPAICVGLETLATRSTVYNDHMDEFPNKIVVVPGRFGKTSVFVVIAYRAEVYSLILLSNPD